MLLSISAILIAPTAIFLQFIGILSILIFVYRRLTGSKSVCFFEHEIDRELWTYCSPRGNYATGNLISEGYRSSWLLVIVIQSSDTVYHYCPVWVDQLRESDFSYLHLQLYLKPATPTPRPFQAVLKSWI